MSHDTWIHRLARICIRPLVTTAVTPNHLTGARLVTGLGASALISTGSSPWIWAGAALFLLSMLLDRADGELARLSATSSDAGHRFDLWSDALCDTGILVALGLCQRDGVFGAWAALLGVVAGASAASIFYRVLELDRRLGPGSVSFEAAGGFDPDDAIAIVPLGVCLGLGDWVLAAAAVATPICALALGVRLKDRERQ